jgi:hypothetical protein
VPSRFAPEIPQPIDFIEDYSGRQGIIEGPMKRLHSESINFPSIIFLYKYRQPNCRYGDNYVPTVIRFERLES